MPLPTNINQAEFKDLEFRTIFVRGHFDHGHEVYIGPRSNVLDDSGGGLISTSSNIGFHVITPFQVEGSDKRILGKWPMSSLHKCKQTAVIFF